MVINRGQQRGDARSSATLYLYDLDGHELWQRVQPAGSWCAAGVRVGWNSPAGPDALLVYSRGLVTCEWQGAEMVYRYVPGEGEVIYDGEGNILDTITMQYSHPPTPDDLRCGYYALTTDVWGDSRDEVLLFGSRSACIIANARPLAVPTLYTKHFIPGCNRLAHTGTLEKDYFIIPFTNCVLPGICGGNRLVILFQPASVALITRPLLPEEKRSLLHQRVE